MSGTTEFIHMQPKAQNGFRQQPGKQLSSLVERAATVQPAKTHSTDLVKENLCKVDIGPKNEQQTQQQQQQLQSQSHNVSRLADEKELVELLKSFRDRSQYLLNKNHNANNNNDNNNKTNLIIDKDIEPPVKRSLNGTELKIAFKANRHQKSWDQFYSFPRLYCGARNDDSQQDSANSGQSSATEPFVLQPSLFHKNHVPPTIYFNTKLSDKSRPPIGLPKSLQHMFKWKISSITPNTIRNCVLFQKFDIVRQSNTTDNYYIGAWCKHMPTADFSSLEEWRKVNHYPGSFHMGRKDKLWLRLRMASQKYPDFDSFHPMTFVLPKDYQELDKYWKCSPSNLFIVKPPASARGNGVKVINNISQIPEDVLKPLQANKDDATSTAKRSTMIVQQYISNPCLLENRQKFDLRVYVLVTSVDPLKIYVYEEGLVRFASSKYTSQEDGIIDQYMHLTNYFINKNNQEYQINNDCDSLNGCKWTLTRFWRYIEEHYDHVNVGELWQKIIDIIVKTIICCEAPMVRLSHANCQNDYSSYELFGFDIILDEHFKPWILEVNITPSLKSESNLDTSVKYRVIKDMFNLVGYHLPPPPEDQPNPMSNYEYCRIFFDKRLYTEDLTKQDKIKQLKFQKLYKDMVQDRIGVRDASGVETTTTAPSNFVCGDIVNDLTQADIRVLMLAEDELSRCGQFKRVFPSSTSGQYLKYFDKPRYYNLLLDAWVQRYKDQPQDGIRKLADLADGYSFLA